MYLLKDITKNYGTQQVLKGVSLELNRREMVSVMGKSGAGKSTLLGIMAGLVRPDAGRVEFEGLEMGGQSEDALADFRMRNVGIVFQDFRLIPSLSVADNILIAAFPVKDVSKAEKTDRMETLTERVGLKDMLGKKADNLSGGEKQRVAIARSLINKPSFVLADEPTGNLDEKTSGSIMELFAELHSVLDTTFVIVTHDEEIAEKTQKIYRMADGRLS
ncbi:MAG: ABC transporter ATP-binding protein [Deferribacterales bacterium]